MSEYFRQIDFSQLNRKELKAPFRPSMLEHRKNVAKKESQKLEVEQYHGDPVPFLDW
jgi:hypothetical protein